MIKSGVYILSLLILLTSCKEEEPVYETTIQSITEITYHSAQISNDFVLTNNPQYIDGGICWSTEAMPDVEDNILEDQYLNSEVDYFSLDGLYAEQIYYLRSYLKISQGNILYSDQRSFTTLTIPEPPCAVTTGNVKFGTINQTMTNLVEYDNGEYYYSLKSECFMGDLEFRFKQKPRTGIYHTGETSFMNLEETEVYVQAHIDPFNCFFGCSGYYDVYVNVAEDETITVSFCEIGISGDPGCSSSAYILQGKLTN